MKYSFKNLYMKILSQALKKVKLVICNQINYLSFESEKVCTKKKKREIYFDKSDT